MAIIPSFTSSLLPQFKSPFVNSVLNNGGSTPNYALKAQPANPDLFYSMLQLDGYEGPAVETSRASDSNVADIGFDQGYISANEIATAADASYLEITTIYDQSGNGYDGTNGAASGSKPEIDPSLLTHNKQGILFWEGTGGKDITIPSGFTGDRRDLTVMFALSMHGYSEANSTPLSIGASVGAGEMWLQFASGKRGATLLYDAFIQTVEYIPTQKITLITLQSNDSGVTLRVNGTQVYSGSAAVSETFTGGQLFDGGNLSQYWAYGDFYHLAAWLDGSISGTALAAAEAELIDRLGIETSRTGQFVILGDSKEHGQGAANGNNVARQLDPLLSTPCDLYNFGKSGIKASDFAADVDDFVANVFDSSKTTNILYISVGHNDLNSAVAGATLFSGSITTLINAGNAAGYSVLVATIPPSALLTAGEETERQAYNAAVLNASNQSSLNYDATDIGAIAELQDTGDTDVFVDGTHMTALGYGYIAAKVATDTNSLFF